MKANKGEKTMATKFATKEPLNEEIKAAARLKFARITGISAALLTAGDVWRDVARDKWSVPVKDNAGVLHTITLTRKEIKVLRA